MFASSDCFKDCGSGCKGNWLRSVTLHGRRCRCHLEGGNGHVGLTRRESYGGFVPDLVLKCSYGPTYHNQVKTSIGQRSSSERQRRRFPGQLVQGSADRGPWWGTMPPEHRVESSYMSKDVVPCLKRQYAAPV